MAKIFLDANIIVDIISRRQEIDLDALTAHDLIISVLSVHLAAYFCKINLSSPTFSNHLKFYHLIPITIAITEKSLLGPTPDFEDNVQLQSCIKAESDYFVTRDRVLLKLGIFGSTQILHPNDLNKYLT